MLIHISDENEYTNHLMTVLDIIEKNGIGTNFGKGFLNPSDYLGHKISNEGIQVDVSKIEKIEWNQKT